MYWRSCSECGEKWHASEGWCGHCEERVEENREKIIERIQNCCIEDVEIGISSYNGHDDFGDCLRKGMVEIRLFIDEDGHPDELVFTEASWSEVETLIKRKETKNEA